MVDELASEPSQLQNSISFLEQLDALIIERHAERQNDSNANVLCTMHPVMWTQTPENKKQALISRVPHFHCQESYDFFSQLYFNEHKEHHFKIFHHDSTLAIFVKRPFRLAKKKLKVFDSNSNLIGSIRKHFSLLDSKLQILDERQQEILWIKGPKIAGWHKIKICKGKDIGVGVIKKNLRTNKNELFTDADSYEITFPQDTDGKTRSLLIVAAMFVDMLWFESTQFFK